MRNHRFRDRRAMRDVLAAVIAAGAAAGAAHADVWVSPLVLEGDMYNGFPITSGSDACRKLVVNNWGVPLVESVTSNPNTAADGVVISGWGSLLLAEGQSLNAPAGASIRSFDSISRNGPGWGAFVLSLNGTGGANTDSGVFFHAQLVIQEGDLATAAGLSSNTPYLGWFETRINDQNQIMMMASVDDPAIAGTVDRAIMIVDNPGGTHTETVIAKEGDQLIPGRFVEDFSTGTHSIAFRNGSRVAFIADLDGDTLNDGAVFMHDGSAMQLLAREGSPAPVAGRHWGEMLGASIDVDNHGNWLMRGDLDGSTNDDTVIVLNGTEVIAREGGLVPASVGPFSFTGFGSGAVAVSDGGGVMYYAEWSDPDTSRNAGIFLASHEGSVLLVQKGVTQVDGVTLVSLSAQEHNFSISRNGISIVFEGTLADGRDGAFMASRSDVLLCRHDYNGDTTVEFWDYLDFVADFAAGAPRADFNGDGIIDFFDYLDFLVIWVADC